MAMLNIPVIAPALNQITSEIQTEFENQKTLFKDVMAENKTIMNKIKENYSMGKIAATNPQVETINSYAGQSNRSRIIRPLDDADKQSGLILPPQWLN